MIVLGADPIYFLNIPLDNTSTDVNRMPSFDLYERFPDVFFVTDVETRLYRRCVRVRRDNYYIHRMSGRKMTS